MKPIPKILICLAIAGLMTVPSRAEIVDVSGPNSNLGDAATIISPPSDVLDDCVTNTAMQGFNEAQGVLTSVAHSMDSGAIPSGYLVDSHMIFLNSEGTTSLIHRNVEWSFDQPIIGVMSDVGGTFEAASTNELGALGTNYTVPKLGCGLAAPFGARGLEKNDECEAPGDGYFVSGNTIKVCMYVSEPGDWIRVVTGALPVALDIKPGSCPNPLNVKSQGVIPVAILGTDEFDVTQVDVASVKLAGLPPIASNYEDVATPFLPFTGKEDCEFDCTTGGPDGYSDLTLKFNTQEIVAAIGEVNDGDCLPLQLTGFLNEASGGTPIIGEDVMRILKMGK